MKIEVWSDYVCPFCYIGKRRLEEALKSTGLEDKVELIFKAYELGPDTPKTSDKMMRDTLVEKYNMSDAEAKNMTDNIELQAKEVGLNYDFDNMRPANTFDAHRLVKLAETEEMGGEMAEKLLHSYFVEAKQIGDNDVLVQLAEKIGLSNERVMQMLDSDDFAQEVKNDIAEAGQIGVKGVPFFVINRKYAISGAQPAEAFAETLLKVVEEEGK